MKGSHSSWFYVVELGSICYQKEKFCKLEDKLSPCQQHGFLRSEKKLYLAISNTFFILVLVCPVIFQTQWCGRWKLHMQCLVMAISLCW